jgi:hypothetical protein
MRRRAKKGCALGFEEAISFGNESLGKQGNVGSCSQRIQILEGHGIGTIVEDNDVAVVDKERTGRRKIARLDIHKRVVEELIGVRPPMEGWDLEDERDSLRKRLMVKGNPRRRHLVFRSIWHRRSGRQQGARWRAK